MATSTGRGRATAWVLILSILAASVTACSGGGGGAAPSGGGDGAVAGFVPTEERSLTSTQAESLALVRRRLADVGTAAFDIDLDLAGRRRGALTIDWAQGVGYGSLRGEDAAGDAAIAWRADRLFLLAEDQDVGHTDEGGAAGRPMTTAYFDVFLTLLLRLGVPAGESPQLLRQSTARYLGEDTVNGVRCIVLTGPDPESSGAAPAPSTSDRTRYWIAPGGELQRFAARLGDEDGWAIATRSTDGVMPIPSEIVDLVSPGGIDLLQN